MPFPTLPVTAAVARLNRYRSPTQTGSFPSRSILLPDPSKFGTG